MVNVENINRVADAIETGELVKRGIGFNMISLALKSNTTDVDHFHACNTVACIAGWAYAISHPKISPGRLAGAALGAETIQRGAASFLGIGRDVAIWLFFPIAYDWGGITPAHAVAVLRHLARTGEVDWSITVPNPEDSKP